MQYPWLPEEDAFLRAHAGREPMAAISALMVEARLNINGARVPLSPTFRTVNAIRTHAQDLGLVLRPYGTGRKWLAWALGVRQQRIKRWIDEGWLADRPWSRQHNVIEQEEVERFLRDCGWLYDISKIRDARYRRIAESSQRRNPWLTVPQASAAIGITPSAFYRYVERGVIPVRRRYGCGGDHPAMVVQSSDIPSIAERIADYVAGHDKRVRAAMARARAAQFGTRAA